jgi:hypothetical protein
VGDVQSGGKPRSGGSVGSWEEDGPRVGHHWAGRTGWAETSRWAIIED